MLSKQEKGQKSEVVFIHDFIIFFFFFLRKLYVFAKEQDIVSFQISVSMGFSPSARLTFGLDDSNWVGG